MPTQSLILCLVVCAISALSALGASEPPLLPEHQPFRAELAVVNPYDVAVRVVDIDQSCTCSELILRSHFLLPGEATTLLVEVENERRSGRKRQRFLLLVSDPELEPIEIVAEWVVQPDVAVDLLPPATTSPTERPELAWQDVYMILESVRPDELHRLRRVFRLFSPTGAAPDGGLQISGVDYPGTIWGFTPRQQDDGSWLLICLARDTEAQIPEGAYEEEVRVRTNHPQKPEIVLYFKTSISSQAGRPDYRDPWGSMR